MFIPVEPAFGLAVQYDPGLFLHALERNVMMVSPSTLLATLQIIANIWKQDRQNRNALEIALKKMTSGTGNLIGRTQKLQVLGAKTSKNLPEKYAEIARKENQVPITQSRAAD